MKLVPYLNFPNTLDVLEFYKKLGAENVQILLACDEIFADMTEAERPNILTHQSLP